MGRIMACTMIARSIARRIAVAIVPAILAAIAGLFAAGPFSAAARTGSPGAAAIAQAAAGDLPSVEQLDRMAAQYRDHWERHPHGQWLLRILPVHLAPSQLPEAESEPARLTALYCVQCHALPDPAMHGAERWQRIMERMLPRMRGEGNQGRLMHEMMRGLQAPDAERARMITAYLSRHAQRPLPLAERTPLNRDRRSTATVPGRPGLTVGLATADGRMFQGACTQCHELPDPASHRAGDWPAIVERMQANMQWMNRVVGTVRDPREPRLDPQRITVFLQAFSSDGGEATREPVREAGHEPDGRGRAVRERASPR